MMEYDNTNRGALFPNGRKEKDTHPDFTGSINVAGREYWLSGWKKQSRRGPLVSLSVKPKEQTQQASQDDPFSLNDTPPPSGPDDYGVGW